MGARRFAAIECSGEFFLGGGGGFLLDFTGRFSIKGFRGRISIFCKYFRLTRLPLPAQGNQPGKQHPSNFERMHSGMEAPAPARLQRHSPEQPVPKQDHRRHELRRTLQRPLHMGA